MKRLVELDLKNLCIRKSGAKSCPVGTAITRGIDPVFCTDIEFAGRGVDLQRPDRDRARASGYGRKVTRYARPSAASIDGFEHIVPARAECVGHSIGDLIICRIDLDLVDPSAAGWQIVCGPCRTMV